MFMALDPGQNLIDLSGATFTISPWKEGVLRLIQIWSESLIFENYQKHILFEQTFCL